MKRGRGTPEDSSKPDATIAVHWPRGQGDPGRRDCRLERVGPARLDRECLEPLRFRKEWQRLQHRLALPVVAVCPQLVGRDPRIGA